MQSRPCAAVSSEASHNHAALAKAALKLQARPSSFFFLCTNKTALCCENVFNTLRILLLSKQKLLYKLHVSKTSLLVNVLYIFYVISTKTDAEWQEKITHVLLLSQKTKSEIGQCCYLIAILNARR